MEPKLNPYRAAIATLRVSCALPRDMNEVSLRFQEETYLDAIKNCHPSDVLEACQDWVSRVKWWPTVAELLGLVREKRNIREAAARPKLPPPQPPVAVCRAPEGPMTDEQILRKWSSTDRLYHDQFSDDRLTPDYRRVLERIWRNVVARRHAEHPELAARYHDVRDLHGEGEKSMTSSHPDGG